jgi:hypothetical protein
VLAIVQIVVEDEHAVTDRLSAAAPTLWTVVNPASTVSASVLGGRARGDRLPFAAADRFAVLVVVPGEMDVGRSSQE